MSTWKNSSLTWLITGASSGFGLALTRLALTHGHKVIATSRDPSRVPDLVSEVEKQGGQWLALDVDDLNTPQLVEKLEAQGTSIDVLVNNAGRSLHGPAESITDDEARGQMETLFFGPYRLIRAVVPGMRVRRRGLIVNIGSGAGVDGRDSMGPYAAGKAAIDGLMRVMSKELAPYHIRTLTVQLGAFNTGFAGSALVTKTPFPEDYQGSMTEKVLNSLSNGALKLDGDHRKAAQAIYEMVVGEGLGEGKEEEKVMILGRDMWRCMDGVMKQNSRMMDTFEDVCNNVYVAE